MDTANQEKTLTAQYDSEQNILYLLFSSKAQKAIAEEMDDEVFVRYDPETRKVISLEFLNFQERIANILGPDVKYLGSEKPERVLLPVSGQNED